MRLHTPTFLLALVLAAASARAAGALDEASAQAVVEAWRQSTSAVNYPDTLVLVEYREKWAEQSHYALLSIRDQSVTGHCLLVEPVPPYDPDCEPSPPIWRSRSVSSDTCPLLPEFVQTLLSLRPPVAPSNCLTLEPATYAVTVATNSSRASYRLDEPEGSFWGDLGDAESPVPAWVRHLFSLLSTCP
ncbi:hypothetical protein BAC2_00150 [uncultured bacterium]|nr:hypothetical protein BAC2_00150 [uncultured bacterium]